MTQEKRMVAPNGPRVYTPGYHLGWGAGVWRGMFRELWASRELTWRLFVRDFLGRYKQTLTGVAGAVISPLAAVATFLLLSKGGVLQMGDTGVPKPVFLFLSLTIWNVFSAGITASSNAIVANSSFVVKINFPKEVLVFSALGYTVMDVAIRAVLMTAVFVLYRFVPAWTAVLAPVALIPLLLLTLGLGFGVAIANALVRDVGKAVVMLLPFLMLITPVVYAAPKNAFFGTLNRFNVLTSLVSAPRELVLYGTIAHPGQFLWASALSVVVFFLGWRFFHLAEVRLAERLGAR